MNIKNPGVQLIIISLIAAAAILIASSVLGDESQTATFLIIAIWFVPFALLTRGMKK